MDSNKYSRSDLREKLAIASSKGLVLLGSRNDSNVKSLQKLIKDIPEVSSMEVGKENDRQVILMCHPYQEEASKLKKWTSIGRQKFYTRDYDGCIKILLNVVRYGELRSLPCALLGLSYVRSGDAYSALPYLLVATELGKQGDKDYHFGRLITKITNSLTLGEEKTYVKMAVSEFEDHRSEYYGISNIEEVAELIASGTSLQEVAQIMKLNDEQKNIVSLILAREYYAQRSYAIGDRYIKLVEKADHRTNLVNSILSEVKKNKKFYQNRVQEGRKSLVLTSNKR